MIHLEKVKKFIREALECSVFVNSREPGLTFNEIYEIGARLGFQAGEIGDALPFLGLHSIRQGSNLLGPDQQTLVNWKLFLREDPEYRNFVAFDLLYTEFGNLARSLGQARAQVERSTMVSRAIELGIPEDEIEAAITIMIFAEYLNEKDGLLRFKTPVYGNGPLPSEQAKSQRGNAMRRETLATAMPIVRDIISRRTDGRPQQAEAFDAFAERLASLG